MGNYEPYPKNKNTPKVENPSNKEITRLTIIIKKAPTIQEIKALIDSFLYL